jgi:cell division transport system permease protein
MFIPFIRILKTGFSDFWRNKWVSQATLGVMIITLFVIVSFFMLNGVMGSLIADLKSRMDISVYFKIDTDESEILKIKNNLSDLSQVKNIEYISRSDALTRFQKRHQNDPLILQSLEEIGSNPLTASLNVQATDPTSDFPFISQFLDKNYSGLIDKVNYQENKDIISRISSFSAGTKKAGIILSLVLVTIVILVTFNTIRLTIYSVRDEIGIMRLVGASNAYIRGPFIIEGIIYGVIATFVSTLVCWMVFKVISPKISSMLLDFSLYNHFVQNFWSIIGIELVIGIALGALGSYIAIRKYLKI